MRKDMSKLSKRQMTKSEKFIWGMATTIESIFWLLCIGFVVSCLYTIAIMTYTFLWDTVNLPLPHSEPWHDYAGGGIILLLTTVIITILVKARKIKEKYDL